MQQISLYVIIILLVTNMVTGGFYYSTKVKLTESESQLEKCTSANTANTVTIGVKETLGVLSEASCNAKIEAIRSAELAAKEKEKSLDSLYKQAKDRVKKLEQQNKTLASENQLLKTYSPPQEMTDEEALEIVNYLDTLVPVSIERSQLHRIRVHHED